MTAGRLARIHVTTYAPTLPPEGHWSHDTHLTFDQLGQLTVAHNGAAAVAFSYDSLGRQTAETLTLDGALVPGFGSKTVTRTLDDGGRATALALPSGATVSRAYTPGDALQSLSVGGTTLWSAQLAGSVPTTITRGNGLVSTWTHSPALLPTQVDTATPTLPTHSHGYTWTAGQLRRGIARDDTARQLWRFHYDGAGHLETGNGIPAIRATTPDLPVPPGTDPATLRREDWQVNLVDELESRSVTQDGRLESVTLTTNPLHQVIAKRRQIGGVAELTTYTWTPDGALQTSVGPDGTTTLVHDWRDRLVEASTPAAVTAELVLDPLGRLVAKRTTTPAGTRHRAYLHDGDQVVEEYASAPGHTGVLLARRHHWGRWIDDLVADEADTDGDGTLETTLYPVTDLLGSVELLTDAEGRIVERIAYDPDGTPHVWGEDTARPRVTQLAWTGTGASPTGATVAARTLVLRFSEAIHDATMAGLTLTLAPDPGSRTPALDSDGRTLTVTFEQPIPSTTPTTFHLDGLRDRTGNAIFPFDTTFTLTDSQAYAVLADTTAPSITAVIDTAAGLVLSFDEPVTTPAGTPIEGAVTLTRSGLPVGGTTTRLSETALAWTPTEPASWQPGGEYQVTALTLQDLHSPPSPVQTAPLPLTITHLATQPTDALLAYAAPTDSAPLANSQYGQTALFQGREWHADLGMYYYRARWYAPSIGFAGRDPLGPVDPPSLYQSFRFDPLNNLDPFGLQVASTVLGQRGEWFAAEKLRKLGWRVFFGGEIGGNVHRHGADIFAVNIETGELAFVDDKNFIRRSVSRSAVRALWKNFRSAGSVERAINAVLDSDLDDESKEMILRKLSRGQFRRVVTAAAPESGVERLSRSAQEEGIDFMDLRNVDVPEPPPEAGLPEVPRGRKLALKARGLRGPILLTAIGLFFANDPAEAFGEAINPLEWFFGPATAFPTDEEALRAHLEVVFLAELSRLLEEEAAAASPGAARNGRRGPECELAKCH